MRANPLSKIAAALDSYVDLERETLKAIHVEDVDRLERIFSCGTARAVQIGRELKLTHNGNDSSRVEFSSLKEAAPTLIVCDRLRGGATVTLKLQDNNVCLDVEGFVYYLPPEQPYSVELTHSSGVPSEAIISLIPCNEQLSSRFLG